MRRLLVWLAAILLVGACRAPLARRGPEPPRAAPPGPAAGAADPDPATPDLAGGPEDAGRPHFDPPEPPRGAYLRGDRRYRIAALTFDDGPDGIYTPRVLDQLKRYGVRATFYLVGKRAAARPDIVQRIVREGHEVGNHSWDHAELTRLDERRIHLELFQTHQTLVRLTGRPVRTFRPPYGALDDRVLREARAIGYATVLWNVDSLDWKRGMTRDDVLHNVLPAVRNGSIILMHSAGGKGEDLSNTVEALPLIIKTLRGQGYRLVTISELLATGRPLPGQW